MRHKDSENEKSSLKILTLITEEKCCNKVKCTGAVDSTPLLCRGINLGTTTCGGAAMLVARGSALVREKRENKKAL